MNIDYEVERKMKKAISKFPSTIRPTEKQFIAAAVNTYIDVLVKERIIRMWTSGGWIAVLLAWSMDADLHRFRPVISYVRLGTICSYRLQKWVRLFQKYFRRFFYQYRIQPRGVIEISPFFLLHHLYCITCTASPIVHHLTCMGTG